MADGPGDRKLSRSPREDFDPLKDFLDPSAGKVYNSSISCEDVPDHPEEESPSSSIDLESEAIYGVTPPVSLRTVHRERKIHGSKKRDGVFKEGKDAVVLRRNHRNKGEVNVIRDSYADGGDPTSLGHMDSDEGSYWESKDAKERKRRESRESKKTLTASRSSERFAKMNNGGMVGDSGGAESTAIPMSPIPVDTPYRYRSVKTKPAPPQETGYGVGPDGLARRPPSFSKNDCPEDRKEFYRIFSTLINMGSHAKKEKDQKINKATYTRQKSSEQEIWQTRLKDLIWLELQAWHSSRKLDQEDEFLERERAKVPEVLQGILKFKLNCDIGSGLAEISPPKLMNLLSSLSSSPSTLYNTLPQSPEYFAATAASFQTITLTETTVQCQRDALKQVDSLLEKLEICERLFPTLKAFSKYDDIYRSHEFRQRVKALYLWLNVTRDLCQKMKEVGKMMGVQNVIGAVDWPWMDYQPPKQDNPLNPSLYAATQIRRMSIPEVKEPQIEVRSAHSLTELNLPESGEGEDSDSSNKDSAITGVGRRGLKVVIPPTRKVQFSPGSEQNSRAGTPVLFDSPVHSGCSTPTKLLPRSGSALFQNLSRASSELCLDDLSKTSVYRYFVEKSLKKMGMHKLLIRLHVLLHHSLQRAKEALERPKEMPSYAEVLCKAGDWDRSPGNLPTFPSLDPPDAAANPSMSAEEKPEDWNKQFMDMGLPSFRPSYLFLTRIKLDVIHECLRLRLEQRPKSDPSFLSIRQLIHECKEVLKGAVSVKQYYQRMVSAVLWDDEDAEENFASSLEQFDTDMRKMLEIYFSYLQNWMYSLQNLPEASRSLKNALEVEWTFTKKICPHVGGGEAEAGKKFSTLASSLLSSISDFLEQGMDDCTAHLFDMTLGDSDGGEDQEDEGPEGEEPDGEEGPEGEDADRDQEVESLMETRPRDQPERGLSLDVSRRLTAHSLESLDEDDHLSDQRHRDLRHSIQQTCRDFKNLFHEARERASKALGFAKMLRKDLEIAADFNIAATTTELLQQLKETGHVRVIAPTSAGYLMFIPQTILENKSLILQLLNVTCGREGPNSSYLMGKDEGYLLMVRCEGGADKVRECPMWNGQKIYVEPTAETTIALSHIEVDGLLLVVIHSSQLGIQRRDFEQKMGLTVELVNEQTSCHQKIAEALEELKTAALNLREKVVQAIKQVDEKLNLEETGQLEEGERSHLLKLYRETMQQCYNFGFEYHKEVTRLVTGDARHRLGRALIDFALDWMKFVSQKCERGRGMRPRWASQGLDFLTVACEPKTMTCLTDEEFQNLKQSINDCITHVIGSAERIVPWSPTQGFKGGQDMSQKVNRIFSWPAESPKVSRSFSHLSEPTATPKRSPEMSLPESRFRRSHASESSDKDVSIHDGEDGGLIMDIAPSPFPYHKPREASSITSAPAHSADPVLPSFPYSHCMRAVERLEQDRSRKLQEKRVIGRVTSRKYEMDYHISVRRVNFRWQRGIKIGEGQFGKVYTAVNMDTGELMAMKEMKFQPNDHQAFKGIADEIKNFEGIVHKNLVRYYGVEVHKDELLIFMEYCDRGTIEDAAKLGLPENMIRKYTRDILVAIHTLHEHGIVHRDIKGANIFLTSTGCLKLGDFGCSVRLKSHTTMPGEVNALVGTTAYMAPEVIARSGQEGHGRAADIWSLGCVVLEMVTGKRPWHEFENNYQIMFKVGMGCTPVVPESLSAEGKEFLEHCFRNDPSERATSSDLQRLLFTRVYDEGDDAV